VIGKQTLCKTFPNLNGAAPNGASQIAKQFARRPYIDALASVHHKVTTQ